MEETVMLVLLVLVMLIGSYLAGNIPLIVNLSEEKLKRITVFGAGLLVGTALAVIIPEGIRSLAVEPSHSELHSNSVDVSVNHVHNTDTEGHQSDSMSVIGVSLVLGFVFMLLVDQISINRNASKNPSERNITATIGLVVHAAADGVALGAAATTSHADVEIIVFLAIMLHKAPAAFGLVTFLLHEGIDRQRIRRHLIIFSLAAPLLTLITYFGIGQEGKERLSSFNATGIAMLFSAGTFLYVATVHVLAELTQNPHPTHSHLPQMDPTSGSGKVAAQAAPHGLRCTELTILVIGCITPLFLTLGHHH